MKICCLSDIHGYLPEVPDADLLLLAGDYCRESWGWWYAHDFTDWLADLSKRMTVVGVAGNHDRYLESHPDRATAMPWTYLCDTGTTFRGLKIFGSPWQPTFYNWSFNLDEPELAKKWEAIPDDTDVLVLHGPPHGYGDKSTYRTNFEEEWPGYEHAGSPSLTERILKVQPKLVVAGHIHSGYGLYKIGESLFVSAAYVDESYQPKNQPIVVEI